LSRFGALTGDNRGITRFENMMGTVRRVCRNVKRRRNTAMALRWTAAGMMEAAKGFRRLKAYYSQSSERRLLLVQPRSHQGD